MKGKDKIINFWTKYKVNYSYFWTKYKVNLRDTHSDGSESSIYSCRRGIYCFL